MIRYRTILTQGNALEALRKFLLGVWQQANLDGMIVPKKESTDKIRGVGFIHDPKRIHEINPFNPIMTENSACKIPTLLQQFPNAKLGVILRPCELRAAIETSKMGTFSLERLLTISIDCLKTIYSEDYSWWLEKKTTADAFTEELLQFARLGGITAYRYRPTCQMCISPRATDADINISVLGIPVREMLLVRVPDEDMAKRLNLEVITDGFASPRILDQHEKVILKMDEYHKRMVQQTTDALQGILDEDIEGIISHLEDCDECEVCMDVCPICAVNRPQKTADGHYDRQDIIQWILSCAGCGMCEQACQSHFPLSAIFRRWREILIVKNSAN